MQNVAQRYVMGVEAQGSYVNEQGNRMEAYLHFPIPKHGVTRPTLREANDNNLYVANNLYKVNAGNYRFGTVTYVLAGNRLKTQMLIEPWDTGATPPSVYNQRCPSSQHCSGTIDHFFHVLQKHLEVQDSLADLMRRWLAPPSPLPSPLPSSLPSSLPVNEKRRIGYKESELVGNASVNERTGTAYTEIELMGNFYLPESLAYVNPLFSALWGKPFGRKLKLWSQSSGRPLIWANGDASGMLLDPWVGQVNGSYITPAMAEDWRRSWDDPGLTWESLYAKAPAELRFHLPDYYVSRPLCAAAEAAGHTVLGRNEAGDCVYLNTDPLLPTPAFECRNDGTCVESRASSRSSTYPTMQNCQLYCNSGWRCQENPNSQMMCVPDPVGGQCATLDACEDACVPAI